MLDNIFICSMIFLLHDHKLQEAELPRGTNLQCNVWKACACMRGNENFDL